MCHTLYSTLHTLGDRQEVRELVEGEDQGVVVLEEDESVAGLAVLEEVTAADLASKGGRRADGQPTGG